MFERLRALWDAGRVHRGQIDAAVVRGWITPEQAAEIVAEPSG